MEKDKDKDEAYVVLARKYRPQTFADLTGQEHVVQTLSNALVTNRVAHALLFCGPRGCGKTTSARIVAKALNCVKGPTPNPCGECSPCTEIALGTDVDVQEIDAASNTGVDNVRELRESAKYMPARDRFKIFIVDEVHMLSKAAFNAFLKTLEEPPPHVKFLFATTDPQALPDTILSRCQRHNFRLVPLKKIVDRIALISKAEGVKIDDGALALVARQAAGSMRDALSILDQLFSSCGGTDQAITEADAAQALGALDHTVVSELTQALLARNAAGVLDAVARAYDAGHDLKRLAEDLATHLRNLIAANISGGPLDLPDHELRALKAQAAGADAAELSRLFELVHTALSEMTRAAQPRHAFEIALLRAVHLAPADSVQGLLRRANELLQRLGGDPGSPPSGGGGGGRSVARESSGSGGGAGHWAPPGARASSSGAPRAQATVSASGGALATAAQAVVAPMASPPVPEPISPPASSTGSPWERYRHLSVVPDTSESLAAVPEDIQAPVVHAPVVQTPVVQTPVVEAPPPVVAESRVAPPPAATASESDFLSRWTAAVAFVRTSRPMLGSCLEHALPLGLSNRTLRIGFVTRSAFERTVADNKQSIEALLSEALAETIRLELETVADGAVQGVETIAGAQDKVANDARASRLKVGWEHPSILHAASLLGANIEDVRDLGDES